MPSESKPWWSVFTLCLLPLKVSSSTCLSICGFCCTGVPVVTCPFFSFSTCAEFTGVSLLALQIDDDPLMNAVNLLEENWISIQETFELVGCVLSRLFAGLWLKKRAAIPKDNLTELAKSFDTTKDPTL
jgi:hypothetical protein